MSIIVLCPTRGRPAKAYETWVAFRDTKVEPETELVFLYDRDDPELEAYLAGDLPHWIYGGETGTGMAAPVNAAATELVERFDIIGFVGDDHRFRSPNWDLAIEEALLHRPGFAYGNDLARADIPTQIFITSKVVQALGWVCLPGAHHLYLDNTWAHLGNEAGCLTYLRGVVIEHVHPFFGKSAMDEHYARVNSQSMYQHDAAIYERWLASGQAAKDVATVRAAIG